MQRMGAENGRWKDGRSPTYYRRITKAKPGQTVHHVNENKSDNRRGNLQVIKGNKYANAIARHNKKRLGMKYDKS